MGVAADDVDKSLVDSTGVVVDESVDEATEEEDDDDDEFV